MRGIKVVKNDWPSENVLDWPAGFARLNRILEPLAPRLDQLWWYIGGQGVELPLDMPENRYPNPQERSLAFASYEKAMNELRKYLTEGDRSGRPGFFSRGAGGLSGDWKIYFAADTVNEPAALFARMEAGRGDMLTRPAEPPREVVLIARGIDAAYWEIFFRDDSMFQEIWQHLNGREHLIVTEV